VKNLLALAVFLSAPVVKNSLRSFVRLRLRGNPKANGKP
jgi:hypothetical protein